MVPSRSIQATFARMFRHFSIAVLVAVSFPKRWTLTSMEFNPNRVLSDTDKKFIAMRHRREKATP